MVDRLREDDAVAVGTGDRPRVALGGRQPRGRLPGGRQQPAVHLQAGAAATPTAVSRETEKIFDYEMKKRNGANEPLFCCRAPGKGALGVRRVGRARSRRRRTTQAGIHFAWMADDIFDTERFLHLRFGVDGRQRVETVCQ